ncbi:cytochrome c biogenesis CcdA family protein [Athalassotoga sp.]|uniref:cytochrome c biogenesis CcdA family protein n=1 Tax=Athalassotoga sp. TaxID=2022597 RepID=UPI003D087CD9
MSPITVTAQISYWGAFVGGILSFFSPCIFPILPGFLAFLVSSRGRSAAIYKAVAFSIGLSVIFILLGLASGTFGVFLITYKRYVEIIGGILVVIFGLSYTGLFTLPFFEKGIYIPFKRNVDSFWSAFLFGIVTAFAWTPCIGPALGTILTMAATGNTLSGGTLLSIFSLGLVIPLILASVLIQVVNRIVAFLVKYQRWINVTGGIVLIIFGFLMIFGKLALLS